MVRFFIGIAAEFLRRALTSHDNNDCSSSLGRDLLTSIVCYYIRSRVGTDRLSDSTLDAVGALSPMPVRDIRV